MKILFLGYNREQTSLIQFLIEKGHKVTHLEKKFTHNYAIKFDFIISFGYRHIIKFDIIKFFKNRIINLHVSYLPFGRGSHPIFWSFIDRTPKGVSIHIIDETIDTGDILVQKYIKYKKSEDTFRKVYNRSIMEIEKLFKNNYNDILFCLITPKKQIGKGSFHSKKELPLNVNWDIKIKDYINKFS